MSEILQLSAQATTGSVLNAHLDNPVVEFEPTDQAQQIHIQLDQSVGATQQRQLVQSAASTQQIKVERLAPLVVGGASQTMVLQGKNSRLIRIKVKSNQV